MESACPAAEVADPQPVLIDCRGAPPRPGNGRSTRTPPAKVIYDGTLNTNNCPGGDGCPELKPDVNGLDFWESLEGNLICVKVCACSLSCTDIHSCGGRTMHKSSVVYTLQYSKQLAHLSPATITDTTPTFTGGTACHRSNSVVQRPLVVGADGFGDFYIVPDLGACDASGINARGGVTNDPANNDFNPEVIKVQRCLPCSVTLRRSGEGRMYESQRAPAERGSRQHAQQVHRMWPSIHLHRCTRGAALMMW